MASDSPRYTCRRAGRGGAIGGAAAGRVGGGGRGWEWWGVDGGAGWRQDGVPLSHGGAEAGIRNSGGGGRNCALAPTVRRKGAYDKPVKGECASEK